MLTKGVCIAYDFLAREWGEVENTFDFDKLVRVEDTPSLQIILPTKIVTHR